MFIYIYIYLMTTCSLLSNVINQMRELFFGCHLPGPARHPWRPQKRIRDLCIDGPARGTSHDTHD